MEKRPICCGKPMRINSHIGRRSGQRIWYICGTCGRTKTVKVKGGK